MLNLLYGLNSEGLRAALFQRIETMLSEDAPVLMFVPEQQVLEAEGVLARLDHKHLGEVLSFRRMANTVFRRFGGLRYHALGKGAKQVVMWRALMSVSEALSEYRGISLDDMATVRLLYDTVEELSLYRVTPEALEDASREVEDETFSRKLSDIAMIYTAYQTILATEHDEAVKDLDRARALCDGKGMFKGYHIVLDAFDGLTPDEADLLRVIFKEAKDVTVALSYDCRDRRAIFSKLADTDRLLRKLAADTHHAVEESYAEEEESAHPDILYFAKNYEKRSPAPFERSETEGITALACPGIYEEVRFVAADIKRRVMAGARYRDFAVITRDTDRYLGILDAALEGAKIPFFISSRRDVSAMSTSRMLLSALDIHARGWKREDVIAFMRTGLSPLTAEECDAVEEYAEVWKISGKRWYDEYGWQMNPFGFSVEFDEKAEKRLSYLNTLREKLTRPLTAFFEVFDGNATVKTVSTALVHFLLSMKVGENVSRRASYEDAFGKAGDTLEDHALLHDTLMKILDELVEVAGDLPVRPHEYSRLLSVLLQEADMGTLPSRLDEVTVGDAALIRKNGTKHVYLIGLEEGAFPKTVSDNGCFDNTEKETLALLGLETSPLADRRALDEKLYFYRGVTSASESVTMTYAFGDLTGKEAFPSGALLDTLSLLMDREALRYEKLPVETLLYGAPEILEYAVTRGYSKEALESLGGGQFLLTTELDAKNEELPESVTERLYGNKIMLTQSKTDKYSLCPFAYHCQYTLKLSEGARGQFDSLDIGTFIHEILENFFSRMKDSLKTVSDEEARKILGEILDDFSKKLRRDNPTKRFESLIRRLHRTTELLVMNLLGEFRQSEFTPVLFERDILHTEEVDLDTGTLQVVLKGVVDRADIFRMGDDVYLRVVDYKTGDKKFSMKDVEEGFQLQLLLYLFALSSGNGEALKKEVFCKGQVLPAGALYFSLGAKAVSLEQFPEDEETARRTVEKAITRSGVFLNLPDVLHAMEETLSGYYIPVTLSKSGAPTVGRSTSELKTLAELGELSKKVSSILTSIAKELRTGKAHAVPKSTGGKNPCQYCKMKPICRIRYQEEGGDN